MVADAAMRELFVDTCVELCKGRVPGFKLEVELIDLRWQFPVSAREWEGYAKLAGELGRALHRIDRTLMVSYRPDGN